MSDLLNEIQDNICLLTINRPAKNNAFDDKLIMDLQDEFKAAILNKKVRVILLKANGKHFSAGADLSWMQRMANFNLEENLQDAQNLANLMHTIYNCPKPTLTVVQGHTYGGGIGLIAASDIAIAASDAKFCFSEVKLGIIPAVISPFVIKAIGGRNAKALFMSAELFDAPRALAYNLVHHLLDPDKLLEFSLNYAKNLCANAPDAVLAAKKLVQDVADKAIDKELSRFTASLIAQKRVSLEGQKGLKAFLNKETPDWNADV